MTDTHHFHETYEIHGVAEAVHRHHDLEQLTAGLREDLSAAELRIGNLEGQLAELQAAVEARDPGRHAK